MAAPREPGVLAVRPFALDDLDAAAEFCARARESDPSIEPFAQRLQLIATGPRALLELWRVAEGEDGLLHGICFAAVREQRAAPGPGAAAPREPPPGQPSPGQPRRVPAIRGPAAQARAGRLDKRAEAAPGLVFAQPPPQQVPRPGAVLASLEPRLPLAAPSTAAPSQRAFTAPPPLPDLPEKRGLRKVPVARPLPGPLSAEELGRTPAPPQRPLELRPPAPRQAGPPSQEGEGLAQAEAGAEERTVVELYAAVSPALRQKGLGRALCERALEFQAAAPGPVTLRARTRDGEGSKGAAALLRALGFAQASAQLSLTWRAQAPLAVVTPPGLQLRLLRPGDKKGLYELERLSEQAWSGAPDTFPTRADELAQMLEELERLVLLVSVEGVAAGYLSAIWLGKTLGIEEVAVLPHRRRAGLGRALVEAALARGAASAVLSVSEENGPARALYRALGFVQTARKIIWEKR
jgi:[ribosomal protein S18]-alanine N-acetyltransferase